jgi:hypothetical protein
MTAAQQQKPAPARPEPKAKPEPKPIALKDVKPTHDARLYLAGRKGYWLGRLVKHDTATLTFDCKWHKGEPVKVDRADVAKLEVKRDKAYVLVTL